MATSAAPNNCFKKGAKVEVNFDEPGFRGSWYTGTVFRPFVKRTNKIFVEFDTLLRHDRPNQKHREQLHLISVRPLPPRESHRSFQLGEDVDAFHKDGWWEGIVTAIHPPPPSSPSSSSSSSSSSPSSSSSSSSSSITTYSVYFRSTREQLQFPESDLRLHREWVHGEWVPPLELQPPTSPHHVVDDVPEN